MSLRLSSPRFADPRPGTAPRSAGRASLRLLLVAMLWGCSAASRLSRPDPIHASIEACAARLDPARLQPADLDEYLACLARLYIDEPRSQPLHVAFAQALQTRALGWPDPGRDDLHAARGWALRGLALNPRVGDRLQQAGGRFGPEAVGAIGLPEMELVFVGVSAWARWLHERGVAGAAIDLPALLALAQRARVLGPEHPLAWACVARVGSLGWQLDPRAEVEAELEAAWEKAIRSADPRVRLDYVELFVEDRGEHERSERERARLLDTPVQGRGLVAWEAALIRQRAQAGASGAP